MKFENRESERKDVLNLLDYVVLDESGKAVARAMARTLNVSENGLLLETHLSLEEGQMLLLTIGLENELCEIKGKIVRAGKSGEESFAYGVEFLNVTSENSGVLHRFLEAFNAHNQVD